MSEQVAISIKLLNRVYKIKVLPEHEATVRATAQAINDKLSSLRKSFPGRDEQDYLAMTLIDHMTSLQDTKQHAGPDSDELIKQLVEINQLLDQ